MNFELPEETLGYAAFLHYRSAARTSLEELQEQIGHLNDLLRDLGQ